MSGYSLIWHKGHGHYAGRYVAGIFSDNNRWLNAGKDLAPGWGIKLDIHFFEWIEPWPKYWKLGWWRREAAYNEWKTSNYWFVLNLSWLRLPFIYLAISTPWRSTYVGFKTYMLEPETGDKSWASGLGGDRRCCCLSSSTRENRR